MLGPGVAENFPSPERRTENFLKKLTLLLITDFSGSQDSKF